MTRIRIEILSVTHASDVARLQEMLESAPGYWMAITGKATPEKDAALNAFDTQPPGPFRSKHIFGFRIGEKMVGMADVVRGYPDETSAILGLLLIRESYQRSHFGNEAYVVIEKLIKSWPEIKKIRLSIVENNATVMPFWKKMGFTETGEQKAYQSGAIHSHTIVMEKVLAPLET